MALSGGTQYLTCNIPVGSSVLKKEIKFCVKSTVSYFKKCSYPQYYFFVLDGRFIISDKTQSIRDGEYACLLVVAPDHGNTSYTWEKTQDNLKWDHISVPMETCLLYTKSYGTYKCEVSGKVHYFEVTGL